MFRTRIDRDAFLQVLSSSCNHESILARQLKLPIGILGEETFHANSILSIRLAHDGINAATWETEERVVRPCLLDEVETAIQRALVACEQEPSLCGGVFANFRSVWDTTTENAVRVDAGAAGWRLVATWVGLADVGTFGDESIP